MTGGCLIVSVENLRFYYRDNEKPILDIPQWSLQSGEHTFLHGSSGSGKSTLLNLLAGILLPHAGTINILNKPLTTMSARQRDKWRARHIGVVFQQFNLISYLNPIDNIKLAAHFCGSTTKVGQRAEDLLKALGVDGDLHHQPAAQLSIGQQQRLAIARSLINQPELLIVDEPTSALDKANRDVFMALLLDQVKMHRTALIFVSHDLSLASKFSRVESLEELNCTSGRY